MNSQVRQIYPVRNVLTRLDSYFKEFCFDCGGVHLYEKYRGWQRKYHVARCYKEKEEPLNDSQLNLFNNKGGQID